MERVPSPVPRHIGIIVDGNRRFAKRLMAKPWKGHEWGGEKIRKLFGWCKEAGVEELTLYTLSIQNFNRPKEEFKALMDIFRRNLKDILGEIDDADNEVMRYRIRVRFIGRLWMLPRDVQDLMVSVMDKTREHDGYTVNFAVAYGGREEVMDAVIRLAKQVQKGSITPQDINEDVFSKELYLTDEPDLIIRTGGEHRTSNFLIWQSSYAEWIFYGKKLWPEFEKEDFLACLEEYGQRNRRFGK